MKAVLVLAFGAAATMAAPACIMGGYATFYDDYECKKNGGAALALVNPGCLNEPGRGSIYIQSACATIGKPTMVWSPRQGCPCQNHCRQMPEQQGCWNLRNHPKAESYRFINTPCDDNNCD